ncbi:phage tail-collar fiber domain-containing protein, partial [Clostridioides difficile]
ITLLQALPILTISSYNSTQATFKADHTDPTLLTKIEYFIDYVLKETITTDLTLEKTINYTLEDNALHTLKIVVTDSNNATAEKVLSISKNIMPVKELLIKVILVVSNVANINLKVDPTVILATLKDIQELDSKINTTKTELTSNIETAKTELNTRIDTENEKQNIKIDNIIAGGVNVSHTHIIEMA